MQRWEYKVIRLDNPRYPDESSLDKFGDEGWELVTVTYGSDNGKFTLLFKRPKS